MDWSWVEEVGKAFGIKAEVVRTPDLSLGDFGIPIFKVRDKAAFVEALRRSKPRWVEEIKLVGGYANFILNRRAFFEFVFKNADFPRLGGDRIIVEHTSVNPNKAMHVGHLRNSCLGDSLARLLEKCGYEVERENYVDDLGNQVALSLMGLIEEFGVEKVEQMIDSEERLGDVCWEIYPKAAKKEEKVRDFIKEIEPGGRFYPLARAFAEKILKEHCDMLKELDISFDFMVRESDIVESGLWEKVWEQLKESQYVVKEEEGENKGCWVLKLGAHPNYKGLKNPDKVLIRSNGTLTYLAKDIAHAMWKYGLVGGLKFVPFDGAWISDKNGVEKFGKAKKTINVIDVRQSYLQNIVRDSLELLGYKDVFKNYIHYGYEVVGLSKSACEELGLAIKENWVHMKGREGIGVRVIQLWERILERLRDEWKKRYGGDVDEEIIKKMAIGAIRYYMVKLDRRKVLVFDFDDALSFEGKSGIYVQYEYVRAKHILEKSSFEPYFDDLEDIEWELLLDLSMFPSVIKKSHDMLDLSIIVNYIDEITKKFARFYESCPVLKADGKVRARRLTLVALFVKILGMAMDVVGIPKVERM